MKKIWLMRHSIREICDLPAAQIPLSEDGRKLAAYWKETYSKADKVYASNYRRALETAELISNGPVLVREGLHERILGDAPEDFWLGQYLDYDLAYPGGESLNMVKVRMKGAMDAILREMEEGETALVVSHATAICSYLLNYCEMEVADAATKSRIIRFKGQEVLHDTIRPTDCFELAYVNSELSSVRFSANCPVR